MRYKKNTKVLFLFEDSMSSRKSSNFFFLLTLKVSIETIEQRADGSLNFITSFFKNIIRKIEWGFAI